VLLALKVELARDDDVEVGDVGPAADGAADQSDQHTAEGAGFVMDAEWDCEGDRRVLRIGVDEDGGAARGGEAVEGDQASANPKRRFARQEDLGGQAAAADLCRAAVLECLAGVGAGQARKGADRESTGVEHPPPGEFEADPVDARKRGAVGGEDTPGETNSDGRRALAWQRHGGNSSVEVKRKGPESLPELAPTATYMTLAPFLGAEEAYERSVEEAEKW
jgi:hypothetical protein